MMLVLSRLTKQILGGLAIAIARIIWRPIFQPTGDTMA